MTSASDYLFKQLAACTLVLFFSGKCSYIIVQRTPTAGSIPC